MKSGLLVLAYDIGTTGAKTCLYRYDGRFSLVGSGMAEYGLRFLPGGGVEQDPADWWRAMGSTTRCLLERTGVPGSAIAGISFCGQMQGLALVDDAGEPVRPCMSYLDQRASAEKRRGLERGIRIAGMDASRLLPSLAITGGVSASVKDPLWKYLWVQANEPAAFGKVRRWLDVKECLVMKCTGNAVMTPDSANATFLYDTRPGHPGWSDLLCRIFGVRREHLPDVIRCDEEAGKLLPGPARELGLPPGIPVFGGGGDVTLIALGSGAVRTHDTHLYMGTSGWVSTVVDRRIVDTGSFIASILGAVPGRYNYISEQETSGKCMEWVRDHLALDEIGVYLGSAAVGTDPDTRNAALFGLLDSAILQVPPGSDGVIFTPWLHGNRSPFEDSSARGMFFNIGVGAGKRSLVRSVVEGIGYHNRWQLEAIRKKVPARGPIRFVGGGARSRVTAQVLADILGEEIEIPEDPRNSGALGAAILAVSGLGGISLDENLRSLIPAAIGLTPRSEYAEIYERGYRVFRNLYWRNRKNFAVLNRGR